MKQMTKKAKKIIIIVIAAVIVSLAMIISSVAYFVNVDIAIEELSSNVTLFGWEDYVTYSMLSDELKSVISEEEFNDSSDESRFSMYKKLENLVIDDRPASQFKGSTSWWKFDCTDMIEIDNEEYLVHIRMDFDDKFFNPKIVNFITYIDRQ